MGAFTRSRRFIRFVQQFRSFVPVTDTNVFVTVSIYAVHKISGNISYVNECVGTKRAHVTKPKVKQSEGGRPFGFVRLCFIWDRKEHEIICDEGNNEICFDDCHGSLSSQLNEQFTFWILRVTFL